MDQNALEAVRAIAARPRAAYEAVTVDRLTAIIGAEISGVDLSETLPAAQLAEIRRAFLENHVLVFRDQRLTTEDLKRFGRCFGTLRSLPPELVRGGDPELVLIKANETSTQIAGDAWHTDGTGEEAPSLGSMLYLTETPEIGTGGDTLFANMHLAYEMLSPAMKVFLEGLTAIHDGALPWKGHKAPVELPKTEHPVVVRHPETGRKLLFVNSGFTTRIVQLSETESRALLDMLFGMVEREPVFSCRVRWATNTLVFWDNRCTQHHAVWDYYPFARYGERVTVLGERPSAKERQPETAVG